MDIINVPNPLNNTVTGLPLVNSTPPDPPKPWPLNWWCAVVRWISGKLAQKGIE